MPVLFDEIPLENIGKIKMITAQGNPPFEIGAFAHVASNPILANNPLPVIVVYLILSKHIVGGVAMGSVKG